METIVPQATPQPYTASQYRTAQKLTKAVGEAHQVLVSENTVFPFTLFPDTITVDREKVTIAHRIFFGVAEVISIRIEDILNVTADVGPFFGSLRITTRFFDTSKPYNVNFLWRGDALRIKRVLQGYVIATQKKIDCSVFSPAPLVEMLDKLGQGVPNENI